VGQKTHPTGFRIGINKTHSSTWFANYGVYGDVLKEDYKIRKFFLKKNLRLFTVKLELRN
jgi:small subunit ribosomal protein S3